MSVLATYCVTRDGFSDVHVRHEQRGRHDGYVCVLCRQFHGRDVTALDLAGLLGHLRLHVDRGDRVPPSVLLHLKTLARIR